MVTNLEKIKSLDCDGMACFLEEITSDEDDAPWCVLGPCPFESCTECCKKWLYDEAEQALKERETQ